MKWTPAYHTACQIQKQILAKMGLELAQANQTPKPMTDVPPVELKPSDLCQLAKAWEALEDRKRILRMKGLPKPIDAEKKPKPARATFTE